MLEYLYTDGKSGDGNAPIKVRFVNKIVGIIKQVDGGWEYYQKDRKQL